MKNHEKVIEIFSEVLKKKKNAYLLLVGTGNTEEKKRVYNLVEKWNVKENVRFMGERQDATAIMSIFDCLVLPSYSEAFSLVLVEAQVLGVRAVASTGIPDEVCCNENCFILSLDEEAETWAECIIGNMCQERKGHWLPAFEIGNVVREHLKLYDSLIKNDTEVRNEHKKYTYKLR